MASVCLVFNTWAHRCVWKQKNWAKITDMSGAVALSKCFSPNYFLFPLLWKGITTSPTLAEGAEGQDKKLVILASPWTPLYRADSKEFTKCWTPSLDCYSTGVYMDLFLGCRWWPNLQTPPHPLCARLVELNFWCFLWRLHGVAIWVHLNFQSVCRALFGYVPITRSGHNNGFALFI